MVREAARLHSRPDWFGFQGSERSRLEHICDAARPLLALAVANLMSEGVTGAISGEK